MVEKKRYILFNVSDKQTETRLDTFSAAIWFAEQRRAKTWEIYRDGKMVWSNHPIPKKALVVKLWGE